MQEGNFVFRALSVEFCVLRFWGVQKGIWNPESRLLKRGVLQRVFA
jgi:hypothetical protein